MTSLHVADIASIQCSASQGRIPKKEMGTSLVMKAELKYSSIIYITYTPNKCRPCSFQWLHNYNLHCPYTNYWIFKLSPFVVSSPFIIYNLIGIGLLNTRCLSAIIALTVICCLGSAISFSTGSNGSGCLVQLEHWELSA